VRILLRLRFFFFFFFFFRRAKGAKASETTAKTATATATTTTTTSTRATIASLAWLQASYISFFSHSKSGGKQKKPSTRDFYGFLHLS
jgi:hypothetical protein